MMPNTSSPANRGTPNQQAAGVPCWSTPKRFAPSSTSLVISSEDLDRRTYSVSPLPARRERHRTRCPPSVASGKVTSSVSAS